MITPNLTCQSIHDEQCKQGNHLCHQVITSWASSFCLPDHPAPNCFTQPFCVAARLPLTCPHCISLSNILTPGTANFLLVLEWVVCPLHLVSTQPFKSPSRVKPATLVSTLCTAYTHTHLNPRFTTNSNLVMPPRDSREPALLLNFEFGFGHDYETSIDRRRMRSCFQIATSGWSGMSIISGYGISASLSSRKAKESWVNPSSAS